MFKRDFIKRLAKKNRRPQQYYKDAINEILDELQELLKEGKKVQFPGFGSFYTSNLKERTVFHIKTKQKIKTPAVRITQFRPGDVLKRAVRKKSFIASLLPKGKSKKK